MRPGLSIFEQSGEGPSAFRYLRASTRTAFAGAPVYASRSQWCLLAHYRGPEGLVSGEECMLRVYRRRHTIERMGRIDRLARALDGKPRLHKMDGRFASHASFRPF